jgi:hypothetical protein
MTVDSIGPVGTGDAHVDRLREFDGQERPAII